MKTLTITTVGDEGYSMTLSTTAKWYMAGWPFLLAKLSIRLMPSMAAQFKMWRRVIRWEYAELITPDETIRFRRSADGVMRLVDDGGKEGSS